MKFNVNVVQLDGLLLGKLLIQINVLNVKNVHKKNEEKKTFAGGGGTGLSMQPVCFLAVHADGSVEMIALGGNGEQDALDKVADIIEKAPGVLSKIKGVFSRKKKGSDAETDEEDVVDAVANAAAEAAAEVLAENE
jgi:uncharacterized spore protein YtfJ